MVTIIQVQLNLDLSLKLPLFKFVGTLLLCSASRATRSNTEKSASLSSPQMLAVNSGTGGRRKLSAS